MKMNLRFLYDEFGATTTNILASLPKYLKRNMTQLLRLAKCIPILYCLAFYISWGFMPTCCRPMTLGLNIGGWDANAARRPPPSPPEAKLREKGKAINEPSEQQ